MKDFIEEFISLVKSNGKVISTRLNEKYFQRIGKKDLFDNFISHTDHMNDNSIHHRILFCESGFEDELPKCHCGNQVRILNRKVSKYCSFECSLKDDNRSKKISQTKKNISESKKNEIQEKRRKSMIKKYGVEFNSQRKEVKEILSKPKVSKEISDKLNNKDWLFNEYVTLDKSAVEIGYSLGCYYGTILEYCRKHGFEIKHFSHSSVGETKIKEFISSFYNGEILNGDRKTLDGKEIDLFLPEIKVGFEFDGDYWHRNTSEKESRKDEIANSKGIILNHIKESFYENFKNLSEFLIRKSIETKTKVSPFFFDDFSLTEFEKFINNDKSTKTDNIHLKEYCDINNIPYTNFSRISKETFIKIISEFLNKNEINFTITDNNFILENKVYLFINMLSDYKNSKKYYDRTNSLEEKGFRVIQFFEYHLLNPKKFNVLKNIILHSLNKTKNKIYARNCRVKISTPLELKEFFETNNIQGYRNSNIAFSLVDENNNILMSYCIGHSFLGNGNFDCEISRGACKLGYSIVGGASKLWKEIIKYCKSKGFKKIVYYVDRNFYDGKSLGFLPNSKLISRKKGFWNYFPLENKLKNRDPKNYKEINQKYRKTESMEERGFSFETIRTSDTVIKIENVGTSTFVFEV